MTSPGQVAKLKRNNYVVNRIKPDNEQIYYIIDAINDAINAGTVSYTHLDVYKRQEITCMMEQSIFIEAMRDTVICSGMVRQACLNP